MRRHLASLGFGEAPQSVVVALSGGCDSVVLLYLLRFRLTYPGLRLVAAHLDHAMRPDSAADADWTRGLCLAWGVPLRTERLTSHPRTEEQARDARYAFLRRCAAAEDPAIIATGHHADDQAETVLFRIMRGTGLRGLAGISARSEDLVRPLLGVWREELQAYAAARGLTWRTDVTNASLDPVRNRIRHEVMPLLERSIAPGARRSLVSLAAIAAEAERALERLARSAEQDLVRWEDGVPSLARDRLHLYDSAVTTRVLRNLLRHFGVVPGRTGTRRALQFITDAESGRQMPLSGLLRIEIEFDRARFRPAEQPSEDCEYRIDSEQASGEASIRIGGVGYRVGFGQGERSEPLAPDDPWAYRGGVTSLAFPLLIRGWREGDRMRTHNGRRSLKKIFLERRVPRSRRRTLPLLVDASGDVVWVAGLRAHSARVLRDPFTVRVWHD